jgi:SRSO17 transposase
MGVEVDSPLDVTDAVPAVRMVRVEDLAALTEELATYHARFAPLFARREQRGWAEVYLRGLLIADVPRKNVEAMALRLLGAGDHATRMVRALQQFISKGAWDDETILAAHQGLVEETLGEADGVLIIDGSDIPKRGKHSVGVARQWCGAAGKTENCQAGVYLGYASRKGYTLLDRRLYLPRPWFTDAYGGLRRACAIPDKVTFQTKIALAVAMVQRVHEKRRVPARWLVCDEWYGRDVTFREQVAATGLRYLAEVPCDTILWPLQDPATGIARARPQRWIPPSKGKGRPPSRERLHPDSPAPLRVDALVSQLPPRAWRCYRILEGSKGPLVADFVALRAVAAKEGLPDAEVWLLVRRSCGSGATPTEYKYYLSNAPADLPHEELVRVSGMRWPIESCFEEGKGELGLDQYELRSWRGWHHHMTLVILAHHFLVRLQRRLSPRGGASNRAERDDPRRHAGRAGRPHSRAESALEPFPGPLPAAGGASATGLRCRGRPGPPGLSAAAQGRRLPRTSQTDALPPGRARPALKSRCRTRFSR